VKVLINNNYLGKFSTVGRFIHKMNFMCYMGRHSILFCKTVNILGFCFTAEEGEVNTGAEVNTFVSCNQFESLHYEVFHQ
jgi:hypothetical protein